MFHVMPNKMEEYKEWGDAESRLTAASWDWMQSGPRAMNEGGEETGRCRLSNSYPGVLARACAHVVCVCVSWRDACNLSLESVPPGQVSHFSPQREANSEAETFRMSWNDWIEPISEARPRDQSISKGHQRAKRSGGRSVGVREWKTGRMEGGKTKKRDSYYRAGCRGRLFSPSSLCGPEDNDWRIGRESELNPNHYDPTTKHNAMQSK